MELFSQVAIAAAVALPVIAVGLFIGASICRPPIAEAKVSIRNIAIFLFAYNASLVLLIVYSVFCVTALGGTTFVAIISAWLHVLSFIISCAVGLIVVDYRQRKEANPNARLL